MPKKRTKKETESSVGYYIQRNNELITFIGNVTDKIDEGEDIDLDIMLDTLYAQCTVLEDRIKLYKKARAKFKRKVRRKKDD